MIALSLVGMGTGNPRHLTLQAIAALNGADLVLIPRKAGDRAELAALRHRICAEVLAAPLPRMVEFDLPERDGREDYRGAVDDWHDAIAAIWEAALSEALPEGGRAALLIWGDPSLYDSSLRIAGRLARRRPVTIESIPGITSIQALCAAHAIALNGIGEPVHLTTGRRLRDEGWPPGASTVVVMLDTGGAFASLAPAGLQIWWGARLGMAGEALVSGPLAEAGPRIIATRAALRERHGWVMDIYLLRRGAE